MVNETKNHLHTLEENPVVKIAFGPEQRDVTLSWSLLKSAALTRAISDKYETTHADDDMTMLLSLLRQELAIASLAAGGNCRDCPT